MNNKGEFLRRAVITLVKSIPYSDVSIEYCKLGKDSCTYRTISQEKFQICAQVNFTGYSLTEIDNVYQSIVKGKDVFGLIKQCADNYLQLSSINQFNNGKKYRLTYDDDKALGWRYLASRLGDDMFAAAFLATSDDVKNREKYTCNAWRSFIFSAAESIAAEDKDKQVEYAENHFHLKASCRTMDLNWIALMNYPAYSKTVFLNINRALAVERNLLNATRDGESLYSKCMKAALYRVYLWVVCSEIGGNLEGKLEELIRQSEGKEIPIGIVSEVEDAIFAIKNRCSVPELKNLDYIDVNRKIVNDPYCKPLCSYKKKKKEYNSRDDFRVLLGERRFLLECFYRILGSPKETFSDFQKNLFYRYLIIRHDLREEMVQGNGVVGLKNFTLFQNRKEYFSELHPAYLKNEMPRMTLHETINRNVKYLEARIVPGDTPAKIRGAIVRYISSSNCSKKELENTGKQVFFVAHFPKRSEKKIPGLCRHSAYRRNLMRCEEAIKNVLKDPNVNYYLRGIDTCSEEIGCRPEVFARTYREMLTYRFPEKIGGECKHFIQATYHAGEDFLDLVNGLRTIDEVLLFCGYRTGCRIGHGLALGLDPYAYYQLKNFSICLSKQEHLDDLVWMHQKATELKLSELVGEKVISEIEEEVKPLLGEIGYADVSIEEYYKAWMLRGDEPTLYASRHQKSGWHVGLNGKWGRPINDDSNINPEIRDDEKIYSIMHDYHYSTKINENGGKVASYEVKPDRIRLVELLQNHLISLLEKKGICVESNPSSNLEIGPFARYDEHPIIRLNADELISTPYNARVNVSINTDDIGIFDTALENEYTIMRKALERATDKYGNRKYYDVNKWINVIRENGLKQSFVYEKLHD